MKQHGTLSNWSCRSACCLAVFFVGWSAALGDPPASFQGLGDLPGGGYASLAWDVSVTGDVVVGASWSGPTDFQAFRWTPTDGMVGLIDPFGEVLCVVGNGVSGDGVVVVGDGEYMGASKGFLWIEDTGVLPFSLPGSTSTSLKDVTPDGWWQVGHMTFSWGTEAARANPSGELEWLGDLPGGEYESYAESVSADGSVIVGWSYSASGREAFRWDAPTGRMVGLGDLTGGDFDSRAMGVSADGVVVVGGSASTSGPEAFRWTEVTGMTGLGDLPGGAFASMAASVSANGAIVVGHSESAVGIEAFIWDARHGMRSLRDLLAEHFNLDLTGWVLTRATGVSGDGTVIVGNGENPKGDNEAWIAHVPRPLVSNVCRRVQP